MSEGIESVIGVAFLYILPFLFSLDIFLWHSIGKEIIYTRDKKLIIKGRNRVFPVKKKIRLEKIEALYLWKSKGFFKSILRRYGKQGMVCIKYNNGRIFRIGRYLNEMEASELLTMLKSEIGCISAKPC